MIELKPNTYNNFKCPECTADIIEIKEVILQGIHILAECKCSKCGLEFFNDLPIGHGFLYPQIIGKNNLKLYSLDNANFFSQPLINSIASKSKLNVEIIKKTYFHKDEVIILNCIDYLYGHVLLKLFNSQYYLDNFKDFGLIIIIPKGFEWLIPDGISELWVVNINLKDTLNWYTQLENFFKNEIQNHKRVLLSAAFSHPDFTKIDISKFTKIKKFEIDNFKNRALNITFIIRQDRIWTIPMYGYIFRRLEKFKFVKYYNKLNLLIQNRLITLLCKEIKKEFPSIIFNVVGFGLFGKFNNTINDNRVEVINEIIEKEWCKIYSKSHLVIGVHGSNMIIPTALSAGFIEILPDDRLGNILQDIGSPLVKRELLFLCRFVSEFAKPEYIAKIVVSIIKNFESFQNTMSDEYLDHDNFLKYIKH